MLITKNTAINKVNGIINKRDLMRKTCIRSLQKIGNLGTTPLKGNLIGPAHSQCPGFGQCALPCRKCATHIANKEPLFS